MGDEWWVVIHTPQQQRWPKTEVNCGRAEGLLHMKTDLICHQLPFHKMVTVNGSDEAAVWYLSIVLIIKAYQSNIQNGIILYRQFCFLNSNSLGLEVHGISKLCERKLTWLHLSPSCWELKCLRLVQMVHFCSDDFRPNQYEIWRSKWIS